jgi:O-antigen ligase
MSLPLEPFQTPAPAPSPSARLLALWIGLGALVVVLAAQPSTLFDLDRFAAPKELVLHLTALGALLILALTSTERWSTVISADVALIGFALWSTFSTLFATNHWLSTRALALTISGLILFRAGRRARAEEAGGIVLKGLALALVAGALTGLAQAYGFETWLLAESRAPGGTLGNRNFLAHLMAIGAPLLVLLVLEARSQRRAALAATGLGLMIAAMVLTRSRAAWLGAVVSTIVMTGAWLLARHGGRRVLAVPRLRLAGAAAVVAVVAALGLPNRLSWRSDSPYRDTMRDLTNYHEGSGRGRLIQYANSLRLIAIDPVFGTGPGNWPVKYPLVTTRGDPSFAGADPMPTNPWPSSDWVAFATERGVVGALLLLLALVAMGLMALRRLRSDEPAEVRRALALLGVLTAVLTTGAFDAVLLLAPPTLLVWPALGVLLPRVSPVGRIPVPVRSGLLPLGALVLSLAMLRSAGQIEAIARAGPGWPVERLERAVRFDPGSYRLHLMIAQRTGCARGRPHAAAAARLFPYLPSPRRSLAACGGR